MIEKANRYSGNNYPIDKQLCLMQAALFDGELATKAWEKWLIGLDIDTIDHASYQIIPKLYKNLKKYNISHPYMKIFEGVYRRTWVENQKHFYMFSQLVKELGEAGIEDIVLLKGGAMTLACYQDFGIRPMGDIDFLVPKELALKTILKLIDLDFNIYPPSVHVDAESLADKIKMQHAINFIGSNKYNKLYIDLHWSILYDIPHYNIDPNWIKNSEMQLLNDVRVATLSSTDLLYQTCIHGAKYSPVPLIRWVMDAVTLIQVHGHKIDWDQLINAAKYNRQLLPIRDTFNYLVKYFNAPIPADVMRKINSSRFVLSEKIHFKLQRHAFLSLLLIPSRLWGEHSRSLFPHKNIFLKLAAFPRYLQKRCGLTQLWHLPFLLPIKILGTFKKRFN